MKILKFALFAACLSATSVTSGATVITDSTNTIQSSQPSDERLDLNTATADQLVLLPGIGPAKAEAIVSYREQQGLFKLAEDITMVKGIGERLYAKLADKIMVK